MHIRTILAERHRIVPTLPADAHLGDAIKRLARSDVSAVIILRDGRVSGILTRSDILRHLAQASCAKIDDTTVSHVMSPDPVTVDPQVLIHDAVRRMRAEKIDHLPVIDNDRLAGLLRSADLLADQLGQQQNEIAHLQEYIETIQDAEHD